MVGGPFSDVRMILCVMMGVRMRSKRRRRKAKQTEVVEGDRRARESKSGGILYGFRSCMVTTVELGQHFIAPLRLSAIINSRACWGRDRGAEMYFCT